MPAGGRPRLVGEGLGVLARRLLAQPVLELARGHVDVPVELVPELVVDLGVLVMAMTVRWCGGMVALPRRPKGRTKGRDHPLADRDGGLDCSVWSGFGASPFPGRT